MKMLRSRKKFGRCRVEGHGSNCYCEVCQEIQSQPMTRHQEKREVAQDIRHELEDYVMERVNYGE